MKFLKKANTGKTEASQRIITSSSSRLTMVTSTISRIFSCVLELRKAVLEQRAHQADLALQRTRDPGRIEDDQQCRDAERNAQHRQCEFDDLEGRAVEEYAERNQGIDQHQTAEADAEEAHEPAIGVVAALLHADGRCAHVCLTVSWDWFGDGQHAAASN